MRVVLADDAILLREGLARLLTEMNINVLAQASNAEQCLDAVARYHPDAVIIDIRMPPTWTDEGITAAISLRGDYPRLGILLLSQYLDLPAALALGDTGAGGFGYLLKERVADARELSDALTRIIAGETVLDSHIVQRLLRHGSHRPGELTTLTARERDVLALMAEGRTNTAIARRLHITNRTIESHVTAIFTKLALPLGADDHRRVLAVRTWLSTNH